MPVASQPTVRSLRYKFDRSSAKRQRTRSCSPICDLMCPQSPGVLSSTRRLYSLSRMAMILSAIFLTSDSLPQCHELFQGLLRGVLALTTACSTRHYQESWPRAGHRYELVSVALRYCETRDVLQWGTGVEWSNDPLDLRHDPVPLLGGGGDHGEGADSFTIQPEVLHRSVRACEIGVELVAGLTLANDWQRKIWCPCSTKYRMAKASSFGSPDAKPW